MFQLSWWLMCFGYRTYSKSLGTGLMRLSNRRRMRWRKRVLEILPHATFCCVYPACPLQRQTHDTRWEISLLQWAAAPQQSVNHLHYRAFARFFLLWGRCSTSCFQHLWSLMMKWGNGGMRMDFSDRTGGAKWGTQRPTRRWRWREEPFPFTHWKSFGSKMLRSISLHINFN